MNKLKLILLASMLVLASFTAQARHGGHHGGHYYHHHGYYHPYYGNIVAGALIGSAVTGLFVNRPQETVYVNQPVYVPTPYVANPETVCNQVRDKYTGQPYTQCVTSYR